VKLEVVVKVEVPWCEIESGGYLEVASVKLEVVVKLGE
jgi:hypothetical protein